MRPTSSIDAASESTRIWWSNPGVVYFIGAGEPLIAIKIGMLAITRAHGLDSAIKRRMRSIQSSNHELIRLLGLIHLVDGDYPSKAAEDMERELHIRFQHLARFKANTRGAEWFTADSELLEEIKRIARSPKEFQISETVGYPIDR